MKRGKLKLEEKFILFVIIMGLLAFSLMGIVSYKQIGKIIIAQDKEDAMGIAETAAGEIDGDVFSEIASLGDDNYQQVYDILNNYKVNNLITYIYAMKKMPDGNNVAFVVDTDNEDAASFLEEYPFIESMRPAFSGRVCCDDEITGDRWGRYFSAYAPIVDSEGAVVGIVGCDISIESINAILSELKSFILTLLSVFFCVLILGAILSSRELISRDPITEIANYDKLIKDGIKLSKKGKLVQFSGIMFEIKDQKFLRQKIGAANGDAILKEYAITFRKRMKRGDRLYSMGQGRFFALINKEREQLFLDAIRAREITVKAKDGAIKLTISVACGVFRIRENDEISDVVNYALLALDEAKDNDNADMQWFEEDMIAQMINEKEIINSFRTGIVRHEFVVYYQPKVNLDNNRMCGAEALVRWFRNGKIVPPDSFIPILEKNNLITELDFYVFEQVCKDLTRWKSEGLEIVKVSSNFSKLHLKNDYFAEDVLDILKKYEMNPKYIEVELTESSGYYNLKALEAFVAKMNAANISISIDDFGTGYSSLSLLKDLDFDVVKMDKSFFRDMQKGDFSGGKMIKNVIRMVQDLDRLIISEGIETEQQADFLRDLQAPIVQGYLYDKPLPHNLFEKRLQDPIYAKNIVEA